MKKFFPILLVAISISNSILAQTDTLSLSEVVVTGTRSAADVRHLPMTVSVINRNEFASWQQPSLLPVAMQKVPGMMLTSRGMMGYGVSTGAAGGINMRGLLGGSGQMLVLIDGHPQYNGLYGHPISDSYQTLMADRIEIVRSPASVLYGSNAMGGVINIVTRSTHTDGVKTNVNIGAGSYGTLQTEVSNQVRYGKFSSSVAAQYGRSDNHRADMGFEQYGGYMKLGYDFSANWKAYVDLDLTHFNASNPGTTSQPKADNDQWITRGAASIVVENNYRSTNGAVSIYDNFGRHKINDGYNKVGGTPQTDLFRSRDAVAGLSWYQSASLFSGNRTTVGFDYQHIYGRAYYTDRATGAVVTTARRLMQSAHSHENEVAGYADIRQDLSRQITVDVGLRYDHHSTAGGEWIPQAGIVWRQTVSGELKASAAKGFRNPNTREMYMYGTANSDSLRAERLWNYELSWRQKVARIVYGVNIFYAKGSNLIQTVNGRNINTGKIENCGLEVEAQYAANSRWMITTNHSFLHMKHHVVAAPEYKGFVGINFNHERWNIVSGLQYVTHLYTAVGDNDRRENFWLLNATVNYACSQALSLWLRGENLLAQRYETNLGYPMPRATFMGGVNISF